MKFQVHIESHEMEVEIKERDGLYAVSVNGKTHLVDAHPAGHRDFWSLLVDNASHLVESAPLRIDEGRYYATVGGRRYDAAVLDERLIASMQAGAAVADTGLHTVVSPMPGLIVDIRVAVGDPVSAGSPVVIMEAMKMQNELVSEIDGVVKAVHIAPQDAVDSQTPLVEIEQND